MLKIIYFILFTLLVTGCRQSRFTDQAAIDDMFVPDFDGWVAQEKRCEKSGMFVSWEQYYPLDNLRYDCHTMYRNKKTTVSGDLQEIMISIVFTDDTTEREQNELYSHYLIDGQGKYSVEKIDGNNVIVGTNSYGWTHRNLILTLRSFRTHEEKEMLSKFLAKYPSDLVIRTKEEVYLYDRNDKIDKINRLNADLPYFNTRNKLYMVRQMCYYEEILRIYANEPDLSCHISASLNDKDRTRALEKFILMLRQRPINVDELQTKQIYISQINPESQKLMKILFDKYYYYHEKILRKIFILINS